MREPIRDEQQELAAARKREADRERMRQQTAAARAALAVKQTRKIQLIGWKAVDLNSPGALAVKEWREDLMHTLGGEDALTPQKKALVNAASLTMLMITRLDDLILVSNGPLVDVNTMEIAPFVLQRETLIAGLRADLKMLGIERRAPKRIHDLGEILSDSADDTEQEVI
jgi:hypothetical protein